MLGSRAGALPSDSGSPCTPESEHATEARTAHARGARPRSTYARHRFRLVLEDLGALARCARIVVEARRCPTSVSASRARTDQALFILPAGDEPAGPRGA